MSHFCYVLFSRRLGISYVCVTHHERSGFNVYRGKGRPTLESVERLSVPEKVHEDIINLRKAMSYEDGTEIVLILSFASDDMVRMVNMFPEVFFMDVTCSTNRQNKPLFLMVVKDANGETHIGNISVLPSEKKWVFNEVIRTIFITLYGTETIKRNRLILTDEDSAEYEPVMNAINTTNAYSNSSHMLCVFHALAKKFKEMVYPKLPHDKSGGLTEIGLKYGTYCFFLPYFITQIINYLSSSRIIFSRKSGFLLAAETVQ